MKKLSEFVTKNKIKTGVLLLCFMVLIVACICYINNNKQIATIPTLEENKLKAQQQTTEPEGYTGITTKEQLAAIKDNLSGKYILMADLDMTDVAYEIIGQTASASFTGTFDGNYHKISNLKIESANQNIGMFGYINGATIENLTLENVNITGTNTSSSAYVGGLTGYNNNGSITNVCVKGKVNAKYNVGGLVGYNTGKITNSYVEGEVIGTSNYTGGLVGSNYSGTITNSYTTATITGTTYVGGLAGQNNSGTITNTYATGRVSGTNYAGGLVGYSTGTITNTYAVGQVTATGANVGGLIGYTNRALTNSYYAKDTTKQLTNIGGEGKFFSSMLNQDTYQNWDFSTIWEMQEGATLPYLKGMTKPESVKKENYTYINWEGEGTQENPYLIKTVEQLNAINYSLSAHYKLANDINMQGKTFDIIGQTNTSAFTGTFNGSGHKISNLTIESANQYVGMFGYVNGATVESLTLENININGTSTSSYAYVGGLIGYSNNGVISNICITGEVIGSNYVGGLTVYSSGTIANSYVTAKVTGKSNVGGLAGDNRGTIESSYATGTVTGTNYLGGLVGYNAGTIENSYATGAVTGTNYLGGLVGSNYNGTITNTYATGRVSGTNYAGGLVGYSTGTITNTYAVGQVTATGANVGGLIGYTYRALTNSYYAKDTTKQLTNIGGEGKFFSSMLNQDTYQNWDFSTIWKIEEGNTLPYLKEMAKPEQTNKTNYTYINWEGEGTSENPYLIKTVEELNAVNYLLSAHYKLANDINMQDKTFEIIGQTTASAFTGTLDGNYHKISNLKIESANQYVGMFGYINGGTIKNLGLENANIKGTANNSYTGGIVGQINNGTIQNSYVTGEVSGISNIGGLVGNLGNGTITSSYATATVTGTSNVGGLVGAIGNTNGKIANSYAVATVNGGSNVGGLVGNSSGIITNTYVIGEVTGTSSVGGLVGYNSRTITNSYAVCKVNATGTSNIGGLVGYNYRGTATSSYWAVDQSNQSISAIGEGKFLSDMLREATFKNWEFGTIWEIEEHTLPYLKGMTKPEDIKAGNYTYVNWEGEGTSENPYLIKTTEQLNTVSNLLNAHYKLENDIDMADKTFEIIGKTQAIPFTGTFDGNNHKINNLKIESDSQYLGMFGYISGGTVKNLMLENVNIVGTSTHIGGLVGSNYNGTISNVAVTGEVVGTSYVGGLAGYNSGKITDSYAIVKVIGDSIVGGLVGQNYNGTITNTYAIGPVTASGTSNIGGLIGSRNNGTVNNSYWAIDTSGQTTSAAGEGRFISVMLKQEMYKSWVFDTTWSIEEDATLPYLKGMAKPEAVNAQNYTYINWEGEGTSENPYLIKTAEQLNTVSGLLTLHYKLANDIDMQDKEYNIIGQTADFTGTFDGNGYKISNLTIESNNQYVGMFGRIGSGTVKNLGLENVNIKGTNTSSNTYVGGLVGYLGNGTLDNVYVKGEVTGVSYVGGLVGYLGNTNGKITNSYVSAKVAGISYTGGLIGCNNGIITNSYVAGEVATNIAINETGSGYIGGLVGQNSGTITNAYSTANVTATAGSIIGGLVGYNPNGKIGNTYAAGKVNIIEIEGRTPSAGGLIGTGYNGSVTNSYWAIDTTNRTTSYAGEGKATQELLQQATYQNWDFTTIWEIEEGNTLPYLKGMERPKEVEITDLDGKGTQDSPYLIKTPEDLIKIKYVLSGYYQIENDIDVSEIENFELITGNFKGTLDGKNHSINNLTMKSNSSYTGLFKQNEGTIQNLKLNNVNIESSYNGDISYIGGVCAYNKGTIKNVEVSGRIKNIGNVTDLYMGQIVGYNEKIINKTHSNGSLINEGLVKNGYVGGITGYSDSIIRISYNTGNISLRNIENLKVGGIAGKSYYISCAYSKGNINVNATSATIGGIAGENVGKIQNTYSVENIEKLATTYNLGGIAGENISIIQSSYYNNPSIIEQDGKGTLKTIEELKQQNTFENWDFDNIWSIEENINTPVFQDIFENDENYYENDEYEADNYWEWHTRTTTNDQAYNGTHIIINPGKSIDFYGYGITSYKDYLYKYYDYAGEKTFMFKIDETKANYHTLDGAGFIFNASKKDNLLSGYVLLIRQSDICIYRLDNVNAETFEKGSNATIQTYAGAPIASVTKTSSTIHNLIIKTSPTNVTIVDNEKEILNVSLDYSKHAGEDFGLISSYAEHNCNLLSKIQFLNFLIEVKDYSIPVIKENEINKRLVNAKFQVKNAEGKIIREGSTNANGIYNIKGLQEGTYTLEEIEAPEKHAFNNYKITFKVTNDGKVLDVNTNEEITIKIVNERLKFGIKVVDSNGNPIPNSKVNLYDSEGNEVLGSDGQPIVVTTNSEGTAIVTDIKEGTYTFKQTQTSSEHIISDTVYTVEVGKDGTVRFEEGTNGTIVNKKYGNVIIRKYITGTKTPLSGAVIGIYREDGTPMTDKEGNSVQLTTSEDGTITFKITPGTYIYKEITAPAGYVLNDTEYTFTVADDGVVTFNTANGIIYNDRVRMAEKDNFTVTKYRTGTEIALSGAVIGIFDAEGNKVTELITNESGIITVSGLEVGNYYYKEIQAPSGYILNNTAYHFTVGNDGTVTFAEGVDRIIYNTRGTMKDPLIITKYRINTTVGLPGAVIGVFDETGKEILRQTTNESGTITVSGLEVGNYYYKEIQAPSGYMLNNTQYYFTVTNDGTVTHGEETTFIIYDTRVTMSDKDKFTVTKYRTETNIALSGAVIGIFDANGKEITRVTTGESGTITISGLEVGNYYYKEISAPAGYVLNNTEYHFTVTNDGSVTFAEGVNRVIYNDRVTMIEGLTITKYRTNTTIGLPGAIIGVFDTKGNKVKEATTNEAGQVTFTGLEVGSYYYKEISAPAGYVLNNTEYHFTVNNDGTVTLAEGVNRIIYNDRVRMADKDNFTVTKYKTGTEIALSGAVIGIFDAEGKEITRVTTGENGTVTISGLEVGKYYYKEISAPAGYVLNNTEYHFTVTNEGTVTFAENTNGIIYNDREIVYGDVTIRKYITGTQTPLTGAVIGIYRTDGTPMTDKEGNPVQLTTSVNGTIRFKITPGTYMYKEITAPTGYVLDNTEYTFTVSEEGVVTFDSASGIIYNTKVTMKDGLVITKYKSGTEIPVAGAIIGVFDASGKEIARATTNERGQVTFTGLEIGSYYYKEISAPAGYILNNTEYHFTVENDGTVKATGTTNFVIYNDRVKAAHTIITKYVTDTTTPVAGAVIGLFDANGNKLAEQTTNEKGQVDFAGLEPGTYKYKELTAPDGYILNDTMYTFTIKDDGTVIFDSANGIIYNTRVTMLEDLVITKYRTNTETPVAGAVIGVFDETGKELARKTTNKAGQVTFTGLEVGNYYYKEISAPAGYILNNTEYHFTVENNGTVTFAEGSTKVIYNDRVSKDHIIITKYVTDTTTPVSGAIIGLFDASGNKLAEQITSEKGQVDFAGLEPGTYKYKELTAPDGYILNDIMYTFTIKDDGTVIFDSANGIIYNARVTMVEGLVIIKYRTNTTIGLSGAVIGVFDERGKEIERQTTDEAGTVTFTGLEVGNYYYKEISAPTGYVLNSTEYHFTVENDGTVTFAEGTTKVIYNDRVTVDHVIVTKYEEGTKIPVAGAVIGLFDANGNKLVEQTTNEKGQVDFTKLEPGTYKYNELTAPAGYVLNETIYTFTITEEGTVTFDTANGIIYNKKKVEKPDVPDVYGDIKLVKYEEGTTKTLEGAVIGIYDANGNAIKNAEGNVIQFITNEFGEIKFKIKPGTYKYKELIAPEGYELNGTTYTFTVAENGTVIFAENTNGIIYNKKKVNKPDVPDVPDIPEIYGDVVLTKYEEGTKIALKGATIGIYDSEKNEVKATTNENGTISFKAKPGVYQYQELIAPDGYELNRTIYTFTITKTGKVIFDNDTNGIIYDKKKEDKPDIPDKPDVPDNPNVPDVPDKPVTPDKPKDNVIIPEDNTIIKQPAENLVNGKIPQTGETSGIITMTIGIAMIGIYFGIKIRDKQ